MSTRPDPDEYYARTIGAACPRPFANAIHLAVRARGGTLADYVRTALAEQLTRDGFHAPPVARLDRTTFLHTRRGRL